jgi:hypothetical protein
MSGNIREYEREAIDPVLPYAGTIGGDYTDTPDRTQCLRPDSQENIGVYNRDVYVGIRCCADSH